MHPMLRLLEGGDRRSIGKSNEVVALVLREPELFEVLMSGMLLADPMIRMRCADAVEKITTSHPEYLQPYKHLLMDDLSQIEQQEVRWHVAAMLPRLPLNEIEQQQAVEILLTFTHDKSSIVKTFAMQALADITLQNKKLLPLVKQHIEALCAIGTPAMRARGRRILSQLC